MAGKRMGRINEDIQRELSALLRRMKDPRITGVVSVTAVETSSDLHYAKVYISVADKSDTKQVFAGLKSASGWLRRELGQALSLRYTPELQFIQDDSIDRGAHILEMLRDPSVVKPANPANEDIVLDDDKE
ncbi:MAG: 30S ribosome-binding factor RbfA [Oscillospiraceae bacterium]|nr:30S ribosome-binding factor RbfA [Oscillospiraceae bacterium]